MGSLMAGWDSTVTDPNTVNFKRNKSLTKEEIDNFWQSQKPSQHQQMVLADDEGQATEPQSSFNLPHFVLPESRCLVDLEKACKTNDWWTRSNWAFLNEPPLEEIHKSASNYVAQFHVAQPPTKKSTTAN